MSYVWQRWLAHDFREAGLKVIEVDGWRNRGRPASIGSFYPSEAVVVHHTGATSSADNPASALSVLIEGRSDLPGPLCQWATAWDGTVYVIAAGRANVNGAIGKSGVPGLPYGADGNTIAVGNEVMTDGTQSLTEAQRHSIAVTNACVLRRFGKDVSRVYRHEDISGSGKWDLGSRTTQELRDDVKGLDDMAEDETAGGPLRQAEALLTQAWQAAEGKRKERIKTPLQDVRAILGSSRDGKR